MFFFFFSSRRRHTRFDCDWSSDVCSSDLLCLGFLWGLEFGVWDFVLERSLRPELIQLICRPRCVSPERRILTSRSRANDWLKPRPITPARSLSSSPGLRPEPYIAGTKLGFQPL